MLKHGEPNALSVFGLRQLDHRPPHFTCVTFDLRVNVKVITDWIWENLESRFWIGDHYTVNEEGQVVMSKAVAFEHATEASYFGLIIDQINVYQY